MAAVKRMPVSIPIRSEDLKPELMLKHTHFFFYRKFVVYEKNTTGCINS